MDEIIIREPRAAVETGSLPQICELGWGGETAPMGALGVSTKPFSIV
ncbi:hypothetical protein QEV83_08780 [Methylocapsa sp. D3K7]|nr:hypothetical protein [Methylocapsa sp. D3K7]WGJ16315.1 hypothetical protein QEV83_08780 [Methylocapsa sp. D3K7]